VETWADLREQEEVEAVLTEEEEVTSRVDLKKMMRVDTKEMPAPKSTQDQEEVLNSKFEHMPKTLILNLKTDIITKH